MSTGKTLLGVLAGIAAGATLGILFAPHKGSKTRKIITDKGDDYADELKEKFDEFSNLLNDKLEKVQDESEEIIAKTKDKYNEIKKEADKASS
jgi:gas vesicle protein